MEMTPYHEHQRCAVCGRRQEYRLCRACSAWSALIYDRALDPQLRYLRVKGRVAQTLRSAGWRGPSEPWAIRWACLGSVPIGE